MVFVNSVVSNAIVQLHRNQKTDTKGNEEGLGFLPLKNGRSSSVGRNNTHIRALFPKPIVTPPRKSRFEEGIYPFELRPLPPGVRPDRVVPVARVLRAPPGRAIGIAPQYVPTRNALNESRSSDPAQAYPKDDPFQDLSSVRDKGKKRASPPSIETRSSPPRDRTYIRTQETPQEPIRVKVYNTSVNKTRSSSNFIEHSEFNRKRSYRKKSHWSMKHDYHFTRHRRARAPVEILPCIFE